MNLKRITDITSKEFNIAVDLGDKNSKTLGFLPYEAFKKYAKDKQLIGAFLGDDLLGYLLYRIAYNKVTIVHLCIDNKHRSKKVANTLVEYLKKSTKQYDGIKLSCRNNYNIDHVWESFNFVPVKEKIGRSKKKYKLTIWWFPHFQNNILTQISDYELKNKIVAVIDMNIFLDIKYKRNTESQALESDWLITETTFYYTREILNEINRSNNSEKKKSSRRLLGYYEELPFKDENYFQDTLDELVKRFSQKNTNDKSDLRHLAYSITGGAEFFITRDREILKKRNYFKKHNLTIYKPSEFITHLDENIQTSKYKPQRLIGTNINSKSISSDEVEFYISKFLKSNEKKNSLQQIISNYLSFPDRYELITIDKENEVLAFIVFDRTNKNKLKIPIFRFLKNNLKITLAKHIIYKAIFTANNEKIKFIEIIEKHLDNELINVIEDMRFLKVEDSWHKININKVINEKEILTTITELEGEKDYANRIYSLIISKYKKASFKQKYNLERYLSPLKIVDLDIPTFIIPIKPHWAEILFDDKSEEKLPLFEPEYELLLNRENVYYRSAVPKKIDSPARILWYLSEDKRTKQKGKIRATSYIDEYFIDNPKKLYKQFEQLGVYKWKDIKETANNKDEVMAFVFSDTELFKNSISLKRTKELFSEKEKKGFMPLSPIRIKNETYIALYKLGMNI